MTIPPAVWPASRALACMPPAARRARSFARRRKEHVGLFGTWKRPKRGPHNIVSGASGNALPRNGQSDVAASPTARQPPPPQRKAMQSIRGWRAGHPVPVVAHGHALRVELPVLCRVFGAGFRSRGAGLGARLNERYCVAEWWGVRGGGLSLDVAGVGNRERAIAAARPQSRPVHTAFKSQPLSGLEQQPAGPVSPSTSGCARWTAMWATPRRQVPWMGARSAAAGGRFALLQRVRLRFIASQSVLPQSGPTLGHPLTNSITT